MSGYLFFLYIVGMILVPLAAFLFVLYAIQRVQKGGGASKPGPMEALAKSLGLGTGGGDPYLPNTPLLRVFRRPVQVEGDLSGFRVLIRKYTQGSGKNQSTYTESVVSFRTPLPFRFTLSLESLFTRIGKSLGLRDIPTGDPFFDERFYLRGNDPEKVRLALFPEIRERLLAWQRTHKAGGSFEARDAAIRYYEQGSLSRPGDIRRFEEVTRILVELAEILDVLGSMDT
ncbi:MAG: hypothetical protein JJT96_06765 [Opitutales bacterium]|nr:hypothetical protein [Opitutales bacterium]